MCWRISSRSDKFITLGHALSCCLPIFVGWYYMYTCVRVSEQLNDELKQNLKKTMTDEYNQTNSEHITKAVDKLQQEVSAMDEGVQTQMLCSFVRFLCTFEFLHWPAWMEFRLLRASTFSYCKWTWTSKPKSHGLTCGLLIGQPSCYPIISPD